MDKKTCVVCSKKLGILSSKIQISDGRVCSDCLHRAGIAALQNPTFYSADSIIALIQRRAPIFSSFKATKKVSYYLQVDENSKMFMVGFDLFEYANLLSYELLEDGETVTSGGLGRAVAGGLIFGGVGAVVGGITGGRNTKGVCTSMRLRLTIKNAHTDTVFIDFIGSSTKKNSIAYNTAQTSAQSCLSALQIITDINNADAAPAVAAPSFSVADELFKFKKLLDDGAVTQEEYDTMKKQLLGM